MFRLSYVHIYYFSTHKMTMWHAVIVFILSTSLFPSSATLDCSTNVSLDSWFRSTTGHLTAVGTSWNMGAAPPVPSILEEQGWVSVVFRAFGAHPWPLHDPPITGVVLTLVEK